MKTILKSFSLGLIVCVGIIILFNISNTLTIENGFISLKVNVGILILFCVLAASLATLLLINAFSKANSKKKLENEKLNIEIESEKIKQLQAKIQTLEEALKMSTKSN